MTITRITAAENEIRFTLDTPLSDEKLRVSMYSPALGEEVEICSLSLRVSGDSFSLSRRLSGRDGLNFCYVVADKNGEVTGKKYVEEILPARYGYPYPTAASKKGLQVTMTEDALALGIRHAALTANLGDFMMEYPDGGNTIYYRFEGKDYYIRRRVAEYMDSCIKPLSDGGVSVNLILLNSQSWMTQVGESFWDKIRHPGFEEEGVTSLFDTFREEGCAYFRAFVSFLADRYTREDGMHGNIAGMIVGNEVNSPWIWANVGECEMYVFAEMYTSALRIAWQCASAIWKNIRIYASLDHCWAQPQEEDPRRYYPGRDLLTALVSYASREGEIPFHIACHPYCADPYRADFWGEEEVTDSPDTPFITMKNPRVLRDFLAQTPLLLDGESRRILFSEVGFHSDFTEAGEELQKEALVRAFDAIRDIPEIDALIYYSQKDTMDEGGLNLGLWRRKPDSDEVDGRKPAWDAYREME